METKEHFLQGWSTPGYDELTINSDSQDRVFGMMVDFDAAIAVGEEAAEYGEVCLRCQRSHKSERSYLLGYGPGPISAICQNDYGKGVEQCLLTLVSALKFDSAVKPEIPSCM